MRSAAPIGCPCFGIAHELLLAAGLAPVATRPALQVPFPQEEKRLPWNASIRSEF